jgi:hypothetical protein
MTDRTDYYRGYDLAIYHVGRPKARVRIQEQNGLPPIHAMPQENTIEAAVRRACELIDERLAAHSSN